MPKYFRKWLQFWGRFKWLISEDAVWCDFSVSGENLPSQETEETIIRVLAGCIFVANAPSIERLNLTNRYGVRGELLYTSSLCISWQAGAPLTSFSELHCGIFISTCIYRLDSPQAKLPEGDTTFSSSSFLPFVAYLNRLYVHNRASWNRYLAAVNRWGCKSRGKIGRVS